MRSATLACLFLLLAATAEARHLTPGVAFTATLQSDTTGATASMTWRTPSYLGAEAKPVVSGS